MNSSSLTSNLSTLASHKPLRWLVTGGCGFIGTSLIKRLVSEGGHHIRILDNLSVGNRSDLAQVCEFQEISAENLSSNLSSHTSDLTSSPNSLCELIVGDIMDANLANEVCKGIDVIVHLAANTGVAPSVENPRKDCETNVLGTLNYLEAARHCKVPRFIFASSGAPVGEVEPPIHEELAPHPVSPYGASKLAGEGYCSAYYRTYGVETVCLRFGNVYGPLSGHKDSVVAKFIKNALNGETLEIYGDGNQTRDFIYIDDLIDAIYKAATFPAHLSPLASNLSIAGEIFQIATNKEHTVNELAELLRVELKKQCGIDMETTYGAPRQGDVKRNYSDVSKAEQVLGWQCETDLCDGLSQVVKWFIKAESNSIRTSCL